MDEVMKKLQEPFTPEEIEWRVGSTNKDKTKGLALAYVTNRAIQDRLDNVFGAFGWKNEFKEWKGNGQLCGISIKNGDEWITKWDGADDSNMEAVKGGLSDSMKRAAYQWGIGRYLYKIPDIWMEIEQYGSSYKLKCKPQLPQSALPEEYKKPTSSPQKGLSHPEQSEAVSAPENSSTVYHCKSCGEVTPEKNYNYKGLGLCWKCQQAGRKAS